VELADKGRWARLRLTLAEGTFGLQVSVLTVIGTAVVLFLGVRHVRMGVLTLGELLLVMGYLAQLYDPLKTLSKRTVGMQSKRASAERVYSLLDDATDVVERPHARPLPRARGDFEFHQVSSASSGDRAVLHQ